MVRSCLKYLLLLFVMQLIGMQIHAQSARIDSIRTATKKQFDGDNFAAALPYSEQLLALFPADGRYQYQTGVCLSKSSLDLLRAYKLLRLASQKEVPVEVYYYLGDVCRRLYRFEEAIDWFRQYMVAGGGKVFNNNIVEGVVTWCENGIYLTKYATDIQVLGQAKVSLDSMIYYYTVSPGEGQLGPMPQELISKVDRKMKRRIPLAVYYPSATSGDPDVIYFSSFGKTDMHGLNLWKTTKTNGTEWEQPVELLNPISSDGDEIFPIPALAGAVLYFASNALFGMGGYDIYKSTYDPASGKWGVPENMGFPINSPADDFFFVPDKDGKTAMFASNRNASGDSVVVYKVIIPLNGINQSLSGVAERVAAAELRTVATKVVITDTPTRNKPKARVEGLQYDLGYMELMTSLFLLQETQDSIRKKVDLARIAFQKEKGALRNDSLGNEIMRLEVGQRRVSSQIAELNRAATFMEEQFLAKRSPEVAVTGPISGFDFLFSKKVVDFFGNERVVALRRLWNTTVKLDTAFYASLELLRERKDLETMLTVSDQPDVVSRIKQSLADIQAKELLSPSDFLDKRRLLSVGIHNIIKERLLELAKDPEQDFEFQAANADMISAQGIFNNSKNVSATLDNFEGIRDALWVEERGLLRYKLVVASMLQLDLVDSLKRNIQRLEHRSSIPFYVFEQPKPKDIQASLKPDAKPSVAIAVKLKSNYSTGLIVADPFPYSSDNPIPFDESLPIGVIYKVQLGAFSQPIIFSSFKGLAPITGENLKSGTIKKYYAGRFFTLADAQVGLVLAKSRGFKDAFLVSWLKGKVVPLTRAQNFEERKPEADKAVPTDLSEFPTNNNKFFRVVIGTFEEVLPSGAQGIIGDYAKGKEVAKKLISDHVVSFSVGNFANFEEALHLKEALLSGGFVEAYVAAVSVQE
ncbi:WD40-like Beta Propeller Repeat [Williamwhitmania taraxaci]|uniref:WD40-like Beta Propeller Repeat n=2 Tax=Williamwhitmania taraxaci TaxID=1640674 RepID=A0A1G6JS01_9BACT|nr:WD40-like Beta Propeller Repeat [Williamwhitmania taraxaci]